MFGISQHMTIEAGPDQRVWFCGDVHGQWRELERSMRTAGVDLDNDLLVLAGDVIDRGPNSAELLKFIQAHDNIYSTLGNHEWAFLKCLENPDLREEYAKSVYGGGWTLGLSTAELRRLERIIHENYSLAITVVRGSNSIGVIHARSPKDWKYVQRELLSDDEIGQALYDFSLHAYCKAHPNRAIQAVSNVDAVVHGHVGDALYAANNQLWIDTHRASGALTLLEYSEVLSLVGKPPALTQV